MILYENLIQILDEARGRERAVLLIDGENDESSVSFAGLWDRSRQLLGQLQRRGMGPGDELVIFSKSNEAFIIAFWAAILGGMVPVPVAVGISDEHRLKLFRILGQMRRGTLYTDAELLQRLKAFASSQGLPEVVRSLEQSTCLIGAAPGGMQGEIAAVRPQDLAFVQYSSGSTSDPKGVCLTHANLCTNLRDIIDGLQFNPDDRALSWMPLTHDMGLIGYHLSVLTAGMHHAIMDTGLFVRRPLLWLSKASELRATQLCSPNFGYKHFLKVFGRKGLPGLDLSPVKLILNGAEPISWELCQEFLAALAPSGLRPTAMHPVYGLAEATLAVTMPEPGHVHGRVIASRHALKIGAGVEPVAADHSDAVSFLKLGKAVRAVELRIADDADSELPAGKVGHIQLRGGSITTGLYHDGDAEVELFTADGWLRTGDVGVIVDGELVVTGRIKDIIIVNGQNYYPHDLEEIAAGVAGLELGKVVVCGVQPAHSVIEEVMVFVLHRQDLRSFMPLVAEIRSRLGSHAGLEVAHVLPVARIPKTTSGKVQRAQLAAAYENGEFDAVAKELAAIAAVSSPGEDAIDPLAVELLAICREFVRDREIGQDDNLFESGVSSLTLTEIMLAFDQKYPGKVDITDLFDYPTLRQIAAFMRREPGTGTGTET